MLYPEVCTNMNSSINIIHDRDEYYLRPTQSVGLFGSSGFFVVVVGDPLSISEMIM